jgi:hypothetical protein
VASMLDRIMILKNEYIYINYIHNDIENEFL